MFPYTSVKTSFLFQTTDAKNIPDNGDFSDLAASRMGFRCVNSFHTFYALPSFLNRLNGC